MTGLIEFRNETVQKRREEKGHYENEYIQQRIHHVQDTIAHISFLGMYISWMISVKRIVSFLHLQQSRTISMVIYPQKLNKKDGER